MVFLCLLAILVSGASYLSIPNVVLKKQTVLYEEQPEDSVDIVYVGSSSTYQFYDIMAVWEEYGITSMCYVSSSLPFDMTSSMIELAEENQDPKLYVIDLRSIFVNDFKTKYYGTYETEKQQEAFISALNLLPESWSTWSTILNTNLVDGQEYLYLFDLLYNHEGFISGLTTYIDNGFTGNELEYKGNVRLSYSVANMTEDDVDFSLIEEDENYELTDVTIERMVELFEYCEANELEVYFTFTPYVGARNVDDQNIRRELGELVTEYGYAFHDFKAEFEEMGMDLTTDFYDGNHVNVLGAEKYTLYAMEYILDEYEIVPDYDQEVIDDWNEELADWNAYYDRKSVELYEGIEAIQVEIAASELAAEEGESEDE